MNVRSQLKQVVVIFGSMNLHLSCLFIFFADHEIGVVYHVYQILATYKVLALANFSCLFELFLLVYFIPYSAGLDFRRQALTSVDVRF